MSDELAAMKRERDEALAKVRILGWQLAAIEQFASAYQPGSDRGWAVAILHDKPCDQCKQDITCGQAYAPLPGAKGYFTHVVCPPPKEEQ